MKDSDNHPIEVDGSQPDKPRPIWIPELELAFTKQIKKLLLAV